ncbi:MAG TPA: ChbG/HpnK family deacetylase [Bacteroidales bacterium]|nr:ChbG/HpnK family deacetylase [Bacteroidales bacterium]
MKKRILMAMMLSAGLVFSAAGQKDDEIRLIVRGDDIGSFHAANIGCIKAYTDGVERSTEVMVPCPWFPEAAEMLNEHPGLDVGVHLLVTSEWSEMKWRPITGESSISDKNGYFYPMVWPSDNYPPQMTFRESGYRLWDVERELRAQIEVALKNIKNVTHVSTHMGFSSADPAIEKLVERLAKEYNLDIRPEEYGVQRMPMVKSKSDSYEDRAEAFAQSIMNLKSGTYLTVEHPAMDYKEMETIGHKGNSNVGKQRQGVTYVFTSDVVKEAIKKKGVKLISYGDLVKEH